MIDKISEFLDRRVVVLKDTTPIHVAARTMKEQNIGCVIVYGSDGQLKGILSDRDIVCEVVANQFPLDSTVASVMTYGVISVPAQAKIIDVLDLMEDNGIRRIPVIAKTVNGREKCLGIITLDDLIAAGRVPTDQLSRIVKRQVQRKTFSSLKAIKRQIENDNSQEHTLHRLYKIIENNCKTNRKETMSLTKLVLAPLVERMPASGASRFISQLPKLLAEDLLNLPAGVNHNINAATIVKSIMEHFKLSDAQARKIIFEFWVSLLIFLNVDRVDFILHLLPDDIQALLQGIERKISQEVPALFNDDDDKVLLSVLA